MKLSESYKIYDAHLMQNDTQLADFSQSHEVAVLVSGKFLRQSDSVCRKQTMKIKGFEFAV